MSSRETLDPGLFCIVPMEENDYGSVAEIFEQGIRGGNATYDLRAADWALWDDKHLKHSRLVVKLVETNVVVGWLALSAVSSRAVFSGVAELSIYIHQDYVGKGLGDALMVQGIASSEDNGYGHCSRGFSLKMWAVFAYTKSTDLERWVIASDWGRWKAENGGILFC